MFIKTSKDDYDTIMWKTLGKFESSVETIYLVSDSEPAGGIFAHINEMSMKYKSPKLRWIFLLWCTWWRTGDDNLCRTKNSAVFFFFFFRYIFILDSNAPDIETNKSFYTNELSKNLILNIYNNGGWGYYKRVFIEDLKDKTAQNQVLKNVSPKRLHFFFLFFSPK